MSLRMVCMWWLRRVSVRCSGHWGHQISVRRLCLIAAAFALGCSAGKDKMRGDNWTKYTRIVRLGEPTPWRELGHFGVERAQQMPVEADDPVVDQLQVEARYVPERKSIVAVIRNLSDRFAMNYQDPGMERAYLVDSLRVLVFGTIGQLGPTTPTVHPYQGDGYFRGLPLRPRTEYLSEFALDSFDSRLEPPMNPKVPEHWWSGRFIVEVHVPYAPVGRDDRKLTSAQGVSVAIDRVDVQPSKARD